MFIDHLLVCRWEINEKKIVSVRLGSRDFSLADREVLVVHKGAIKRMSLKEVGQWMQFVAAVDEKQFPLNLEVVKMWLSVFQRINEKTDKREVVLLGKSQADSEYLKNALSLFGADIAVHYDQGLVLDGDFSPMSEIQSSLDSALPEKDGETLLNFLRGIVFWYWTFQQKNNELLTIKVQLPLVGTVTTVRDQILQMSNVLSEAGIFHTVSFTQSAHEILQITISDPVVLGHFSQITKAVENLDKIARLDQYQNLQQQVTDFLAAEWSSIDTNKHILFFEKR